MINMYGKDNIDGKIVRLLSRNARQSSDTIAKKLKLSSATIRRRVNKLVKDKTVRIVAAVDHTASSSSFITVIALDVVHDSLDKTAKKLAANEHFLWISTTTGRFDILAVANFITADKFYDFISAGHANKGPG